MIELIEELVELKVQKYVEMNLKLPPDLTRFLQAKRETDRRRLEQIRTELVRALSA
jgi:hypothetical protein